MMPLTIEAPTDAQLDYIADLCAKREMPRAGRGSVEAGAEADHEREVRDDLQLLDATEEPDRV